MTIAFIHPHKAFLPEIEAYIDFFSKYPIKTLTIKPEDIDNANSDVHWHFMGMDPSKTKKGIIKIHEYASASLPPFRKGKDFFKKIASPKPDFRLFLNEYVRDRFHFNDTIPFGLRDMGVSIPLKKEIEKKYDFVFCGSVSRDMHFETLLQHFTKKEFEEKKLLVLSRDYGYLLDKYKPFGNILFKGPVPKNDVADYIIASKFALNYKPDIEPHNLQTSTKLLEYAACETPIITTDLAWVRAFQKKYGGNYFYIKPDFSNFTWEEINNHAYSFPDLTSWTWENKIKNSGVVEFLKSKFPGYFS